jgi:ribose transport system permease protein
VAALTIAAVNYTPLGRSFYLVGDNPRAAALAGLPVKRIRFVAFMCCGLLTGLATLILTGRIDSAPPNLSPALPFEAIAAVAIGGIAMSGGEGALWRAVLGSIPIVVLVNGLNLVGIGTYIQMIAIGFITIAVVALDHVQKQGFPRFFARSASATNTARAR